MPGVNQLQVVNRGLTEAQMYRLGRRFRKGIVTPAINGLLKGINIICETVETITRKVTSVYENRTRSMENIEFRRIEETREVADKAIETAQGTIIVFRELGLSALSAVIFVSTNIVILYQTENQENFVSIIARNVSLIALSTIAVVSGAKMYSCLGGAPLPSEIMVRTGMGSKPVIKLNSIFSQISFGRSIEESLFKAAYEGNCEEIRNLQRSGVYLGYKQQDTGLTALHFAAMKNQKAAITLLWYFGCKMNQLDKSSCVPIHYLTEEGLKNFYLELVNKKNRFHLERPHYLFYPPEGLVFKGGGPKGIGYVGVLEVLEEKGLLKGVRRVAGTSAGAITATLVGLGYSSRDIRQILEETDLKDFLDHEYQTEQTLLAGLARVATDRENMTLTECETLIRGFYNRFYTNEIIEEEANNFSRICNLAYLSAGVCKGEKFLNWIEKKIQEKTKIANCTFGEYKQLKKSSSLPLKELYFYVTCISPEEKPICINTEDSKWDNIIMADAVRASMSIPLVFSAYTLREKVRGNTCPAPEFGKFVDGGIVMNSPIEIFDSEKYKATNEPGDGVFTNNQTLVFSLFNGKKAPVPRNAQPSMLDSARASIGVLIQGMSHRMEDTEKNLRRTIRVDNIGVETVSGFFMTRKKREELIASGRKAAEEFYQNQVILAHNSCNEAPPEEFRFPLEPWVVPQPNPVEEASEPLQADDIEGVNSSNNRASYFPGVGLRTIIDPELRAISQKEEEELKREVLMWLRK